MELWSVPSQTQFQRSRSTQLMPCKAGLSLIAPLCYGHSVFPPTLLFSSCCSPTLFPFCPPTLFMPSQLPYLSLPATALPCPHTCTLTPTPCPLEHPTALPACTLLPHSVPFLSPKAPLPPAHLDAALDVLRGDIICSHGDLVLVHSDSLEHSLVL